MLDTTGAIRQRIAALLRIDASMLAGDVPLREVIRDSVALVELLVDLEEEFGVILQQADLEETNTIGQLSALLQRRASEMR